MLVLLCCQPGACTELHQPRWKYCVKQLCMLQGVKLQEIFTEQETLDIPTGTRDVHAEVLDDNIIYKTLMLRGVSL